MDSGAKAKLEILFKGEKWQQDGEFYEHAVLSMVSESLRNYVQRKWEFFQTNLNSLIAIILAIPIILCLLQIKPGWVGCSLFITFAVVTAVNGYTSYMDAMRMDHFLLRNLDKLSKNKTCKVNVAGLETGINNWREIK